MAREKICGIYKITCLGNGKAYVGQSININQRWSEHKSYLRKNSHGNIYLQRAWNKYGEENFEWEIIEECNREFLDEREIYWIDFYETFIDKYKGYNLDIGGSQTKNISSQTKEKMRQAKEVTSIVQIDLSGNVVNTWGNGINYAANTLNIDVTGIWNCVTKKYKTYKGFIWIKTEEYKQCGVNLEDYKNDKSAKKILQLDFEGNLVNIWASLNKVENNSEFSMTGVRNCCKGVTTNYKGFVWRYENEFSVDDFKKPLIEDKKVIQLSMDGELIQIWENIKQIVITLNLNEKNIRSCCNKSQKTHNGYFWLYKKEFENENFNLLDFIELNNKPIVQISLDGDLIKQWKSATTAEQELQINNIRSCCKNKKNVKTAGGFRWMYLSDYETQFNNIK